MTHNNACSARLRLSSGANRNHGTRAQRCGRAAELGEARLPLSAHDDDWPEHLGRKPVLIGEFLRSEEMAEALGVSVSTLNRWASRREAGEDVGPPFHALGGKVRRWPRKGVLAWLAAQQR